VEDDKSLQKLIGETLKRWGYEVYVVEDYSCIAQEYVKIEPHLVLMDITLPYYNGFYWCDQIRKISKVPIVFISSATEQMNIIMAINMGGDDFIAKPFELDVLNAKITGLLRRTYDYGEAMTHLVEHRGAFLNMTNYTVTYQDQLIELTKNEYRILKVLMERKTKIVSREALMKALWDQEYFVDDNTLTVNINRLRKKLHEIQLDDFIMTKKGVGYVIE
jgi:DNA-binding response OmpR family regulator